AALVRVDKPLDDEDPIGTWNIDCARPRHHEGGEVFPMARKFHRLATASPRTMASEYGPKPVNDERDFGLVVVDLPDERCQNILPQAIPDGVAGLQNQAHAELTPLPEHCIDVGPNLLLVETAHEVDRNISAVDLKRPKGYE